MPNVRPRSTPRLRNCLTLRVEYLEDRLNLAAYAGWEDLTAIPSRSSNDVSYLHPEQFRPLQIKINDLRAALADAPSESVAAKGVTPKTLTLPAPDGSLQRFSVIEAPVMAPELAAQFPEIETFQGVGLDDPTAKLRMDISPSGFHAQVLSENGSWYIDPYFHLNSEIGISYYRKDLTPWDVYPSNVTGPFANRVENETDNDVIVAPGSSTAQSREPTLAARTGTQLRTYRLAVAATGEYTAFHGGTVAAAQAAIVTAINRVTGVYESELSIRLQLIGNNSSLIYTNARTDPYTNNNGFFMLAENQQNIDAVIGLANYDIGHVFSTGGGGIAWRGSVGQLYKGHGVTGLSSPINDRFYIDYVSHEIGHQFGANHSFNTASDRNRNPDTAYEPGSGSTIMGYAGITGANSDLQSYSDPYFNTSAFDEIIAYVDQDIPGVGTRTSTGNSVPTVNAGLDYVIPARTPFVLTATGSDSNGDLLTYSWEQRDLGPATLLSSADNGSSPLFRVWNPTTNPSRTFPRLSNLINNTVPLGERLPTKDRSAMKFRVTVRDNRLNGGGLNTDDMQVQVVNTGSAFAVTSPNTALTWKSGEQKAVTWNVAGTDANNINTANVNITLSTDGGLTYPITLASNVPNDGSETITVPNLITSKARVRVQGAGNIFFDISNANFKITSDGPTASWEAISPDPRTDAVDALRVKFSKAVSGFDLADLSLSRNNVNVPLAGATLNSSDNITWTLENLTSLTGTAGQYQLKLNSAGSNIVNQTNKELVGDSFVSWVKTIPPALNADPIIVLPELPVNTLTPAGSPISVLTANLTDVDPGAVKGIAVVGLSGSGYWQYSTNNGLTWKSITGVSVNAGLLIPSTANTQIRFKPNRGFQGFARLNFRGWDQTSGVPFTRVKTNTASFTVNTETAWIAVGKTIFNSDAVGNTQLAPIQEDPKTPVSYTVKSAIGLWGLEPDAKSKFGIAVTSFDSSAGTWQYNLSASNAGWTPFPVVSASSALLLRSTDRLRFVPNLNADGDTQFTFKIWDQSTGNAGELLNPVGAAFHVGAATRLDITPVNDAPILDLSTPATLNSVTPGGVTNEVSLSSLFSASDVDGANSGIAVTTFTGSGTWEYLPVGGSWTPIAKIPAGKVLPLSADSKIRFTALGNAKPQTASLSFKAWDRSTGTVNQLSPGTGSAFSSQIQRLTVAITS